MAYTVTHTCGHTQVTHVDEIASRLVARNLRTQGEADAFLSDQIAWLQRNMCPSCYRKNKELYSNLKPVG